MDKEVNNREVEKRANGGNVVNEQPTSIVKLPQTCEYAQLL